jgi:hypothetical protein
MNVVTDLITQAVLALLGSSVPAMAAIVNGRHVLKYSRPMKAALVFAAPFFALIGVTNALHMHGRPLTAALFAGCFSLFGLCGMLEACLVRIEFDHQFFYTHSPWRRARTIPWSDIRRVNFPPQTDGI